MINKNTSNSNGFSFVELMVVIALIGLLSAIGLPSLLRNLPEKRLKNAARSLYADLQKAKLLAVKENKNVTVTFDTATKQYSFIDDDGNTVAPTVSLADSGAVQYGCNATSTNSTGIGNITFTNLGMANAEDIYLQDDNVQEVCYAVTVSMLGSVKILRYNGSIWE
ncbi:MAG: prepilin-type N-terminal cleavage/methylation domain-containing protein [Candidatus Electrothrix sp. AW1]|nr:prepilin-type N-terminal cleavage/methylation domain-containing protein [Candidatus Electrothrix sp. AX1]MCI5181149.1 prepilin-type N-terminal cleavage/methylation domain-containing protein [Candidatus Electrothrix gigas]